MSDTTVPTTPPAGAPDAENSTIRELRAAQKTEKDRADALAEQLKTIERGKLADTERLTLELADRDKKIADLGNRAAKVDQYETAFQTLYAQELAAVPETARPAIERLSKSGDWNQRLEALRDARALLAPPAPTPPAGGTVTQPTGGTPPPATAPNTGLQPAMPLTPQELANTDFGAILKNRMVPKAPTT